MTNFTTAIMETLINNGDLDGLVRRHLKLAINTLLQTQLTAFLDYEKYDRAGFNSGNYRNGNYSRSFKTEYGKLSQQTLPKCCVHVSSNIAHKARISNRQEICNDFKLAYQVGKKKEAMNQINFMIDKWKKAVSTSGKITHESCYIDIL